MAGNLRLLGSGHATGLTAMERTRGADRPRNSEDHRFRGLRAGAAVPPPKRPSTRGVVERLFQAEEEQFDAILAAVIGFRKLQRPNRRDRIYGSVARREDHAQSDVIWQRAEPGTLASGRRDHETGGASSRGCAGVHRVHGRGPDAPAMFASGRTAIPWWVGIVQNSILIAGERPEALLARLRAAEPQTPGRHHDPARAHKGRRSRLWRRSAENGKVLKAARDKSTLARRATSAIRSSLRSSTPPSRTTRWRNWRSPSGRTPR